MGVWVWILFSWFKWAFNGETAESQREAGDNSNEGWKILFKCLWELKLLILCAALIVGSGVLFVMKGGLPHQEAIIITADSNWLVGEEKSCLSAPIDRKLLQGWFLDEFLLKEDDQQRAQVAKLSPHGKRIIFIQLMNFVHAQPLDQSESGPKNFMDCSSGPERTFKATLYGSTSAYSVVSWKCRRTDDSFTCYELAAGDDTVTDDDIFKVLRDLNQASTKISVTAPDGTKYDFDNQEQADEFKRSAGIK